MNRFRLITYKIDQFILSNIRDKTIYYLIFTALISVLLSSNLNKIIFLPHFLIVLIFLYFAYLVFSFEKNLLPKNSLLKEEIFKCSEEKSVTVVISNKSNNSFFVQNAGLPAVFDINYSSNYAVQFKARIITTAWDSLLT